jgi:hypothetical protein
MESHPLDAAHPQERKAVFVLEPSELSFDGGAAAVEPAPLVAAAGDERLALDLVPAERDDRGTLALCALGFPRRVWR